MYYVILVFSRIHIKMCLSGAQQAGGRLYLVFRRLVLRGFNYVKNEPFK